MGQAQITPKTLLLSHFSEIHTKGRNYGMEIKKGKFDALCSVQWPTFNVGWPPQDTFSLDTIKKVRNVINKPGLHGHPDQYPYILMWQTLVEEPPPWLRPFTHEAPTDRHTILAVLGNAPTPVNSPKKAILQEEPTSHPSLIDLDSEASPLPYAAAAPLQSEAAAPPVPPHSSASLSAPTTLVSGRARGLRPCRQREEIPEEEPSSTSTAPPHPPGAGSGQCWS
jgi:hypothetical protein